MPKDGTWIVLLNCILQPHKKISPRFPAITRNATFSNVYKPNWSPRFFLKMSPAYIHAALWETGLEDWFVKFLQQVLLINRDEA